RNADAEPVLADPNLFQGAVVHPRPHSAYTHPPSRTGTSEPSAQLVLVEAVDECAHAVDLDHGQPLAVVALELGHACDVDLDELERHFVAQRFESAADRAAEGAAAGGVQPDATDTGPASSSPRPRAGRRGRTRPSASRRGASRAAPTSLRTRARRSRAGARSPRPPSRSTPAAPAPIR